MNAEILRPSIRPKILRGGASTWASEKVWQCREDGDREVEINGSDKAKSTYRAHSGRVGQVENERERATVGRRASGIATRMLCSVREPPGKCRGPVATVSLSCLDRLLTTPNRTFNRPEKLRAELLSEKLRLEYLNPGSSSPNRPQTRLSFYVRPHQPLTASMPFALRAAQRSADDLYITLSGRTLPAANAYRCGITAHCVPVLQSTSSVPGCDPASRGG